MSIPWMSCWSSYTSFAISLSCWQWRRYHLFNAISYVSSIPIGIGHRTFSILISYFSKYPMSHSTFDKLHAYFRDIKHGNRPLSHPKSPFSVPILELRIARFCKIFAMSCDTLGYLSLYFKDIYYENRLFNLINIHFPRALGHGTFS